MSVKIIRLQSENIKRISAIEITPEGNLITIGGKNDAGKSSALDSIAYALGGEKLVPSQPIRKGQTDAKIVVELDDLIVTRRFKRDKIHTAACDTNNHHAGDVMSCNCTMVFTETSSSLVVSTKDGAKYAKPQAVLDKLLGALTFDALAFTTAKPEEQDRVLRRLVKLDVAPFEEARKSAVERRSMHKKSLALAEMRVEGMQQFDKVPAEELSMDAVSQEMLKAEEYRKLAEDAERQVSRQKEQLAATEQDIFYLEKKLNDAHFEMERLQNARLDLQVSRQDTMRSLDAAQITAQSARAVVLDTAEIRQKLSDTEETNRKVRANQQYALASDAVSKLRASVASEDALVKQADADKDAALRAVQFPVEGLGLSDEGVLWEGLPLSEVSSSVKLRVSVAVGIALNPTLKVLLIRNGNLLDHDSLKLVAEQADAAGAQVWVEYVTADAEGVSVMLEDGHVV